MKLPFLPPRKPSVAVIRLAGVIATSRSGLNDATLGPAIDKAFARKPVAVALEISSPGGSPAQSALIGARIRRLSDEKKVPVFAFCEDVAASGGYWLACAADEVFVDASTMLGSIGVIHSGFGLQGLISEHGIERRVHTAGTSKSMLDMFSAEKPEDVTRLKGWLEDIHQVFIAHVRDRRGARLDEAAEGLFEGNIWIGARSVEAGLADGVGHLVPVMQARFGDKVRFRRYGPRKGLLSRFGVQMMGEAMAAIEDRAAYARFGL